ncbi:MAG: hypothetical protein IT204_17805 [Fimbriimonadaceae bacterium]|nr:hypothetical protein [Fimbriimonadaceae bacterium]
MPAAPPAVWTAQPFGVPITVRCTDPDLTAALATVAAVWQDVPPALLLAGPPGHCDAELLGADRHTDWAALRWTRQQGRLTVTAGDSLLEADAATRHARLCLAPDALAEPARLRWHFLQAACWWLALQADRLVLHGAGLLWRDRLLLLQGDSGSGKSTTAYAWVQAGGELLSDEMVALATEPRLLAWGAVERLGVRPDAAEWFPELAAQPIETLPSGKPKRLVDLPRPRPVWHAGAITFARLQPGGGAPRRTTAAELVLAEAAQLPAGYVEHAAQYPRLAAALGDRPGWWLPRPESPQATVALLRELLETSDA